MLFCSPPFWLFFFVVFGLYWLLPWHRARVWLLLAASFFFYACWNRWLALLIVATTLMDYYLALAMEATAPRRWRRLLLAVSITVNLAVILPIGISFYTFEAINYTVDVYCGRIRAERNLSHFMLFILFFPHLVAG